MFLFVPVIIHFPPKIVKVRCSNVATFCALDRYSFMESKALEQKKDTRNKPNTFYVSQ